MTKDFEINWLEFPEEHDYPAAENYLNLIYCDKQVVDIVVRLRNAKLTSFKAKDIFRASGLSLLGVSNSHVEKDRQKLKDGAKMAPLLLVRDAANGKVIIADGYHRLCAIYSFSEDAVIPCQIVDAA